MIQLADLFHPQDRARRNAVEALRTVRRERAAATGSARAPEPVPVAQMRTPFRR